MPSAAPSVLTTKKIREDLDQLKVESADHKKIQRALSLGSLLLGLGAIFMATAFMLKPVQQFGYPVHLRQTDDEIASLQSNIAELREQVQGVNKLTEEMTGAKPANVQIARLSAQLSALNEQMTLLNAAIGQSPDKAIAIPLLRKDLENLKDSSRHELDVTQTEINRVYDQNKWFIGLMTTMALGLIGLAVTNFLQLKK